MNNVNSLPIGDDHNYMKLLYNDNVRKQFVACGTISGDKVNKLQKQFNKVKDVFVNQHQYSTWSDTLYKWMYGTYRTQSRLEFNQVYDEHLNQDYLDMLGRVPWIRLSLDLIKSVGVKINTMYNGNNNGNIDNIGHVSVNYQEFTIDDGFETDQDRKRYYEYRSPKNNDKDNDMYVCIFCLQKDDGIKDGQLAIYPHFSDECKNFSYLSYPCFSYHKDMILPLEERSVIVLSGRTVYNIPNISGKGVMRLLSVVFYNNLSE